MACRSTLPFIKNNFWNSYDDDDIPAINNEKDILTLQVERWYNYTSLSPIATIYDEIDAHIGGSAVRAMSQMLVQQSVRFPQQIIAITHNPTLAAAARTHIIIRKKHTYGNSEHHDQPFSIRSTNLRGQSLERTNARLSAVTQNHHEQEQSVISVLVSENDPFNDRRIQELVRMVCGSNDDDSFKSTKKVANKNVEAAAMFAFHTTKW